MLHDADVGDEKLERVLCDVRDLYTSGLSRHGPTPDAVGWRDGAQQLRFDTLARVLADHPPEGPATVADLGCGYGALLKHLDGRPELTVERYDGYDLSAEMLAAAARATGDDPRCRWVRSGELDRDVDYVFVSGTFNVRLGASEADWAEYVRQTLRAVHARARRGIAFNLMTSWVDYRADTLFYADPAEWFSFCRRELSRSVSLRHDYALYEWTMIVGS